MFLGGFWILSAIHLLFYFVRLFLDSSYTAAPVTRFLKLRLRALNSEIQKKTLPNRHIGRFFSASAGNAIYSGCQFGIMVLIARYSSQEDVGLYALSLSICVPIFYILSLGLINVIATDSNSEFRLEEYITARLLGVILAYISTVLVAVVGFADLPGFLSVVALMAVAKSFDGGTEVCIGYLRGDGYLRETATIQIANGVASLALVGVVVSLTSTDLRLVVFAYATGSFFGFITGSFQLWDKFRPSLIVQEIFRPQPGRIRAIIAKASPLGFSGGLSLASTHIPRFVLVEFAGTATLGIYAVAAQPMLAAALFVSSLAESVIGELSGRYQGGDYRGFRRLLLKMAFVATIVAAPCVVAVVIWSDRILGLLYGPGYSSASSTFVILACAVGIRSVTALTGTMLSAMRNFKLNFWFKVPGSLVTVLTCTPFIMFYGSAGAATAVLLGAVFEAFSGAIILNFQRRTVFR